MGTFCLGFASFQVLLQSAKGGKKGKDNAQHKIFRFIYLSCFCFEEKHQHQQQQHQQSKQICDYGHGNNKRNKAHSKV
jgi:hypothetical protein